MVFRKNLRSLERRWEKISKFLGGSGWGVTNISCQLKLWPFVSYQLNFRPFVSCQLMDY